MAKSRASETLQVPMAPMIDVVFQLLIYFVLTFREETPEAHLAVNLPSPDTRPPATNQKPPQLLELTIFPGEVLIQGRSHNWESVRETLIYLGKIDNQQTVIIKTSTLARTEEVVRVLDLCSAAGLSKLNLVTLR